MLFSDWFFPNFPRDHLKNAERQGFSSITALQHRDLAIFCDLYFLGITHKIVADYSRVHSQISRILGTSFWKKSFVSMQRFDIVYFIFSAKYCQIFQVSIASDNPFK